MKKELPSLTGIRGVSALLVFAYHAGVKSLPGGFGVTVFFFLSGYLITTLLRAEFDRTGTFDFKGFYWRRAKRILPPMYLVLGMCIALSAFSAAPLHWHAVAAQLLHLTNYVHALGDADSMLVASGQFWSLAVEEHFYLLFPLALLLLLNRRNHNQIAAIFLAVCGASLLWRIVLSRHGMTDDYIHFATDTRMDSILFGSILALWKNPKYDLSISAKQGAGLIAAALLVLLFALSARRGFFHDTISYTLQSAALMPVFYCSIRFSKWRLFSWLESRPIRALGVISYTFYLSHVFFLVLARRSFGGHSTSGILLALVGTITFCSITYFVMERPLAQRKTDPTVRPQILAPFGKITGSSAQRAA